MDIRKILSIQKNIDVKSSLPDGVILVGSNGLIQWLNDIAQEEFKIEDSQVATTSINTILENGYELVANAANTKKALIAKSALEDKYYEITAREVEGGCVIILRDSTQNYKRISGILEEQESSQKINSDKNIFLVKLANEFNSPIQSIIGFSQALLDGLGGDVSDKQSKYVNIIKKNSSELSYFFNKLVELSQSEGNLIKEDLKYFDIVTLTETIVKANKHIYTDKAIDIKFDVHSDLKKTVYQKETAYKMMIQNLIETVLREIDMGNVHVSLSDASEEFLTSRNLPVETSVLITVSSQNMVILETDLPTIFNPYAIIDKANKRTISRALALGTVSNIAKILGGVVWAEILPMQGLVFNIVIPREISNNE